MPAAEQILARSRKSLHRRANILPAREVICSPAKLFVRPRSYFCVKRNFCLAEQRSCWPSQLSISRADFLLASLSSRIGGKSLSGERESLPRFDSAPPANPNWAPFTGFFHWKLLEIGH